MYHTAYETTLLKRFNLKPIEHELEKLMAMGDLVQAQTIKNRTLEGIYTLPSYVKSIKIYSHPLRLESGKIVLDTRAYLKAKADGTNSVVVPNEYTLMLVRAIMLKHWLSGEQSHFISMDFATSVYMRWISENITRRLSLGPLEQLELMILSGHFYLKLFGQPLEPENVYSKLSVLTRTQPNRISEILGEDLDYSPTTEGFIGQVKSCMNNPRLSNLNPALLYTCICGNWYGANSRELLSSAFEFPPDFLSICYTGLTDRSYRKATLSKLIEQTDQKGSGQQYLMQIKRLMLELTDE